MLKKDLSKFENTCVPQNYYNNQLTKIFDSSYMFRKVFARNGDILAPSYQIQHSICCFMPVKLAHWVIAHQRLLNFF